MRAKMKIRTREVKHAKADSFVIFSIINNSVRDDRVKFLHIKLMYFTNILLCNFISMFFFY